MKLHRTSIRKNKGKAGGYIVTNYLGHQFHVMTKERAEEIAGASKRVTKKRKARKGK